jgi:hypothetical protein
MTSTAAERRVEVCPPASERGFAAVAGLLRLVGARAGGHR